MSDLPAIERCPICGGEAHLTREVRPITILGGAGNDTLAGGAGDENVHGNAPCEKSAMSGSAEKADAD